MAVTQIRGDTQLQNDTLTSDQIGSRTTDLTLYPVANTTTAIKLTKADKSTTVLDIDTSNARVGINNTSPSVPLEVTGASKLDGQVDVNSHKIINLTDPTANQDAATKFYVDALVNGLSWKQPSLAATTAALSFGNAPSAGYTATNTTLTQNDATTGSFTPLDGVTLVNGNRVLIKDETTTAFNFTDTGPGTYTVDSTVGAYVGSVVKQGGNTAKITALVANTSITVSPDPGFTATAATYDNKNSNGIYVVTEVGNGTSTPWVLSRSVDMDTWAEVPSAATFVEEGTANADKAYVCTSDPGGTLGTTDIVFVQFSSTAFSAGNGIDITGTTISVKLATGSGLDFSGSSLEVKTDTVTSNTIGVTHTTNGSGILFDSNSFADAGSETLALASGVAGDGLSLTSGVLSVNVSSTGGLQITSDNLSIKSDTTTANTVAITTTSNGAGIKISSTNFTDGGTETLTLASAGVLYANTNIVTREVPSGTINGSNRVFTFANNLVSGSEEVYLNGILQNVGSGNDYQVTGTTPGQVTFESGNAPLTGSVVLVTYWKA